MRWGAQGESCAFEGPRLKLLCVRVEDPILKAVHALYSKNSETTCSTVLHQIWEHSGNRSSMGDGVIGGMTLAFTQTVQEQRNKSGGHQTQIWQPGQRQIGDR
jgi:hypothetical protein